MDKASKAAAKKLEEERLEKQLRRDLLVREEALDAATLKKIKDKWFDTLLNIRVPEMQDNLRHILHYMEKLIETHNFRKLLFEDGRQALDDMYVVQSQGQSSAIQALHDIYLKRVNDMQKAYSDQVAQRKADADEEFGQIEAKETAVRENMQSMLFQMEQNRDKEEDQMNCDMFLKIDDERSKNTEKLETLRGNLERKMEKNWEEISNTLATYDAKTKDVRQHYMVLKAKDDYDSRIIYQQMKKTQKMFELLDELKNNFETSYAPQDTLNLITDLRDERTKFFDAFNYLKRVLKDEIRDDNNQLKFLTVFTDSVLAELKEICKKGEKILTLYRICRKLETEEEKITPVGDTLHLMKPSEAQDRGKQQVRDDRQSEAVLTLPEMITKDFGILNKFWKKSSKVRLTILALNKSIQGLEKENSALRKSLVAYMNDAASKKQKKRKFSGKLN